MTETLSPAAPAPLTPAALVLKRLGARRIYRALDLTPAAIYRWTYPSPRGSDGLVPSQYHLRLLELARSESIPLEPAELVQGGAA